MARRNGIRRIAESIAGSRSRFAALQPEERARIRKHAAFLFEAGATFARAVDNEERVEDGFVYLVTHPSWPGTVKIGSALNPDSRLASFQTGCPRRAYRLEHFVYVRERKRAERHVHDLLNHHRLDGEWFALDARTARQYLNHVEDLP